MKHIKYAVLFCLMLLSSCSGFLDVSNELAGEMSMEEVFDNPGYTRRFHRYIYTGIPDMTFMVFSPSYTAPGGLGAPWPANSDELKTTRGHTASTPTSGYNAGNTPYSRWSLYGQIRQCNLFLKMAKPIPGDIDRLTEEELADLKLTARFFRAYYHYLLFELYGPVPLMTEIADQAATDLDFERASVDELLTYLDGELTDLAKSLPTERMSDNERVMPTKGLALAVKAKLWVYAASPLLNGGYKEALSVTNNDGKHLFPEKDDSKWVKAKNALEELISLAETGRYALHTEYKNGVLDPAESLYQLQQKYNEEIIWAGTNNSLDAVNNDGQYRSCTPRTEGNGQTAIGVLQEMVDDFFMKDGLDIHESPLYKEDGFTEVDNQIPASPITPGVKPVERTEISNMYLNREPRFYDAIYYQGRRWQISGREIYFHDGGNNGKTGGMHSVTGYLFYKGYNRELHNSGTFKRSQFRPNIIFRLAEFYLLYAEVLNEVSPSDPKIIEYVDRVRFRAGIPLLADIKPQIKGNQAEQRKAIRREMRVELFSEGQRYFNVRRWMVAEEGQEAPQGGWVTGMNMDSQDPKEGYIQRTNVEYRVFSRPMYLHPISFNEIQKSKKLKQNPGWD